MQDNGKKKFEEMAEAHSIIQPLLPFTNCTEYAMMI